MSVDYIERSAKIVQALDPEEINSMSVGKVVYESDWTVHHALGRVMVAGEPLHLAVELPKRHCNSHMLFSEDLVQTNYLIEHAPELLPSVPAFVGALCGEEHADWELANAVITEDISRGGQSRAKPRTASLGFRKILAQSNLVSGEAGPHVLTTMKIDRKLERIVRFFPAPFGMTFGVHDRLANAVSQSRNRLTIVLRNDSELADSLIAHGQTVV